MVPPLKKSFQGFITKQAQNILSSYRGISVLQRIQYLLRLYFDAFSYTPPSLGMIIK